MPKLIVDNDEKEEKLSDVFMVTREFQTSAEFSQHIEKRAVQGGNYIDVLVEYCTRKEIEIDGDSMNILDESESYSDYPILEEPVINNSLNLYENIKCWNSDLTLEKIFDKLNENHEDRDIIEYFIRRKDNYNYCL